MAEHEYLTLVSGDGFEFVVLREAALVSPAIKGMVNPDSGFSEAHSGRCVLEDITGEILDKVVEYMQYWYKFKDRDDVPDLHVPVELCLELLRAADFLGLDDRKGMGF
jgi:transcription elongation factor B subunit 1